MFPSFILLLFCIHCMLWHHYICNLVHNDQAVVLCSGVLEPLTTQTCDASEVVAQFQQSLSLENLSLEQPDLDTKKKIRCLCFKAKTANKPEVVKKLREITPAGTTGELKYTFADVKGMSGYTSKGMFHFCIGFIFGKVHWSLSFVFTCVTERVSETLCLVRM